MYGRVVKGSRVVARRGRLLVRLILGSALGFPGARGRISCPCACCVGLDGQYGSHPIRKLVADERELAEWESLVAWLREEISVEPSSRE